MTAKKDTYVIGCKLPNGLVIRGAGKQFRLLGANTSQLVNGYGLTENVPADVWDDFAKHHAQANIIKNGTVFAVGDLNSARDAAKEREKQLTGLEQKEPKKQATQPDEEK